jgi:hypothetical protein
MRAGCVPTVLLACAAGCAGRAGAGGSAETETVANDEGTAGTSSSSDGGKTTDVEEFDLGVNESICPPSAAVSLCLPATQTEGAVCLCSRQELGSAWIMVGDLDEDGLDDMLVHREGRTFPYKYDAAVDALVAMPEIDWPFDTGWPHLSYLPTLGVAAWAAQTEPGELMFGVYDFASGVGEPTTISYDPEAHWAWAIGDFDGDGEIDLVEAIRDPIDLHVSTLTLTVHFDAPHTGHVVELFSEPIDNPIDTPALALYVSDFDGDHLDDLLVYAGGQGFPRVHWGDEAEIRSVPPTPVSTNPWMRVFDFDGDGQQDILAYTPWYFGSFRILQHTGLRAFEEGPMAPPVSSIDLIGNGLTPVVLGDRVAILALATDQVIAPVNRGAMGWTTFETFSAIPTMRAIHLEAVTVSIVGVSDVDGDGHQEVLVRHGERADDAIVYLFDVVED